MSTAPMTRPNPIDARDLRRRNLRMGLILASVAATFMVGFMVRIIWFS